MCTFTLWWHKFPPPSDTRQIFNEENLEAGLKGAAEAFCESEVSVDVPSRTVTLSKIFGWYKVDFGATERERLQRIAGYFADGNPTKQALLDLLKEESAPIRIKYKEYDWGSNANSK